MIKDIEKKIVFIIQASSTSWLGGKDLCMHRVDNYPVVYHTINKVFSRIKKAKVIVAAPEFDRGGDLEQLKCYFTGLDFTIYYGNNDSPLSRMIEICQHLKQDENYFIRVNGFHLFFDLDKSLDMLQVAKKSN